MISSRSRSTLTAVLAAVVTSMVLLISCGGRDGAGLKRHDLFTIPLGTLPGELDWFYRDGFRMAGSADIQARDGLVYVSGGGAGKVMVFNSYGDLLTYVYDPQRNPAPASSESGEGGQEVSVWSFRNLGSIAVFDQGFLVDDGVEPERRVEDPESDTYYDRVVLRFDRNGRYLGHLGREGFGGSPFPLISSIDVRDDGGIVVISRVPGAWMSYWYSAEGRPVTTVRIPDEQLPGLREGIRAAVYSIRPDPVEWNLHLRLDFYVEGSNGGRPEPRMYTLNLESLEYSEPIVLAYTTESGEYPTIPPDYLGTAVDGTHVLLGQEGPDAYRLVLVDRTGRIIQNRRIRVEEDSGVYRRFRLQNNGLVTGIFLGDKLATVSWWRVDKLIGNER